jgi:hypothetical protein
MLSDLGQTATELWVLGKKMLFLCRSILYFIWQWIWWSVYFRCVMVYDCLCTFLSPAMINIVLDITLLSCDNQLVYSFIYYSCTYSSYTFYIWLWYNCIYWWKIVVCTQGGAPCYTYSKQENVVVTCRTEPASSYAWIPTFLSICLLCFHICLLFTTTNGIWWLLMLVAGKDINGLNLM